MMTQKPWSAEMWESVGESYHRTLGLPLVTALTDGSLPAATMRRYLEQDMLYLGVYSRVLAHIASRVEDATMRETVLRFSLDGIAAERAMHADYLTGTDPRGLRMGAACRAYTDFLQARAYDPVEVEMAAVLPCFVIYQRVAEHILATATLAGHPYRRWVETYAEPAFAEAVHRAEEICDRLAAQTTQAVRERMAEAYAAGAALEERFWREAHFQ